MHNSRPSCRGVWRTRLLSYYFVHLWRLLCACICVSLCASTCYGCPETLSYNAFPIVGSLNDSVGTNSNAKCKLFTQLTLTPIPRVLLPILSLCSCLYSSYVRCFGSILTSMPASVCRSLAAQLRSLHLKAPHRSTSELQCSHSPHGTGSC